MIFRNLSCPHILSCSKFDYIQAILVRIRREKKRKKKRTKKKEQNIYIYIDISRSEQAPRSVFHPRDESDKIDCGFLGPRWCNKR